MSVDPTTTRHAFSHEGQTFYFCSKGCIERFRSTPSAFLIAESAERPKPAVQGGGRSVSSAPQRVTDPVCNMEVDPSTAKYKVDYSGKTSISAAHRAWKNLTPIPRHTFRLRPTSESTAVVQIATTPTKVQPPRSEGRRPDQRPYVCPMCPEVHQIGPGPCPKCGMALEPESLLPQRRPNTHARCIRK